MIESAGEDNRKVNLTNESVNKSDFIILSTLIFILILLGQLFMIPEPVLSAGDYTARSTQPPPEFYRNLSEEKDNFSIIEYPAIMQDHYNPFPHYQSVHKKEILNGYYFSHALKKQWTFKKMLNTKMWPLEILSSRLEIKKIYFNFIIDLFTNGIDLYDINSIRNSRAKYIILHKNIKDEISAVKGDSRPDKDLMRTDLLEILEHVRRVSFHFKNYYQRHFGEPFYEDELLVVFQVK